MNVHFIKLNEKYFNKIDKGSSKKEIDSVAKISNIARKEVLKNKIKNVKIPFPKNFVWYLLAKGTTYPSVSDNFKNINWNDVSEYIRKEVVNKNYKQLDFYCDSESFQPRRYPSIENNINIFTETNYSNAVPIIRDIMQWAENTANISINDRISKVQHAGTVFPVNLEIWDNEIQKFDTYIEINVYTYIHSGIVIPLRMFNILGQPLGLTAIAHLFGDKSYNDENIFYPNYKEEAKKVEEYIISTTEMSEIDSLVWYMLLQYMKQHPSELFTALGNELDTEFNKWFIKTQETPKWLNSPRNEEFHRHRSFLEQTFFKWFTPEVMFELFFFKPGVEKLLQDNVDGISLFAAEILGVPVKTNLIINPSQGYQWPQAINNWDSAHSDILKVISSDIINPQTSENDKEKN